MRSTDSSRVERRGRGSVRAHRPLHKATGLQGARTHHPNDGLLGDAVVGQRLIVLHLQVPHQQMLLALPEGLLALPADQGLQLPAGGRGAHLHAHGLVRGRDHVQQEGGLTALVLPQPEAEGELGALGDVAAVEGAVVVEELAGVVQPEVLGGHVLLLTYDLLDPLNRIIAIRFDNYSSPCWYDDVDEHGSP